MEISDLSTRLFEREQGVTDGSVGKMGGRDREKQIERDKKYG